MLDEKHEDIDLDVSPSDDESVGESDQDSDEEDVVFEKAGDHHFMRRCRN